MASGLGRAALCRVLRDFGRAKAIKIPHEIQRMIDPQSGTKAPKGAKTVAPAGPRMDPILIAAPSIPSPAARLAGVVASVIAAMLAG